MDVMKKALHIIGAFVLSLSAIALADGMVVLPGAPAHPKYGIAGGGEYTSPLLEQAIELADMVMNKFEQNDKGETIAEVKARVIKRIIDHPEELNDMGVEEGASCTPLTMAIHCKDPELAKLMIEKGAVPFPSIGDFFWKEDAMRNERAEYEEVMNVIKQAQEEYPVFERLIFPSLKKN